MNNKMALGLGAAVIAVALVAGIVAGKALSGSQNDASVEQDVSQAKTPEQSQSADVPVQASISDLVIASDPQQYTYADLQHDSELIGSVFSGSVSVSSLGTTFDGRELYCFVIGDENASNKVMLNAGIHAREYITCQLLMKQMVVFLEHVQNQDVYNGTSYADLLQDTALYIIPMVNPDGTSISQLGLEGVQNSQTLTRLQEIAALDGQELSGSYLTQWKANANGVDLNRNFDADWSTYSGAGHASSDHYKGEAVGCEVESAALINLTEQMQFNRTISYHTMGQVIYWYYGQSGALYDSCKSFAERIQGLTGYALDANYEALDPAGYKDWAISKKGITSLTIEVGTGDGANPVSSGQFASIYAQNEHVLEETILDSKGL